jgi:hypothetical protein
MVFTSIELSKTPEPEKEGSYDHLTAVNSKTDRGLECRSGQTRDYKTGICCFSVKHALLRKKTKYWLARNQDIVF